MADTLKTTLPDAMKAMQDQFAGFYGTLAEAGRLALTGKMDIDRAILAQVADSARATAEHGRAIANARDLKALGELQSAFLRDSADRVAADASEVMELARTRTRQAMAPLTGKAEQE